MINPILRALYCIILKPYYIGIYDRDAKIEIVKAAGTTEMYLCDKKLIVDELVNSLKRSAYERY